MVKWSINLNTKKVFGIILAIGIFILGSGIIPNILQPQEVSAQTLHTCLNRVGIPLSELHWIYIPENANELSTQEKFYFLAGQLIKEKIVDASICPSGGLAQNGYANACGIATAMPTVIELQNMLNEPILKAWKEIGVPPVLLKQLIRQESQFWPSIYTSSTSSDIYHYGYGHITHIGMQNALQWNRDLYNKVCTVSNGINCVHDSGMVHQILQSLVATCSTCENGIDPNLVDRSVDILAEVVMGYCYQTEQLIYNATNWHPSLVVDYPTIWKLTLMNYTSGPLCVMNTIEKTFDITEGPMDWLEISANVSSKQCLYGLEYANRITSKYFDFPPKK